MIEAGTSPVFSSAPPVSAPKGGDQGGVRKGSERSEDRRLGPCGARRAAQTFWQREAREEAGLGNR